MKTSVMFLYAVILHLRWSQTREMDGKAPLQTLANEGFPIFGAVMACTTGPSDHCLHGTRYGTEFGVQLICNFKGHISSQ